MQVLEITCLARPAHRLLRPGRRLDLDDVGTPVGKLAHTGRARAHPGEVKHGEACKCFRSAGKGMANSDDAGRTGPSPIQSFLSSARASEASIQNVPRTRLGACELISVRSRYWPVPARLVDALIEVNAVGQSMCDRTTNTKSDEAEDFMQIAHAGSTSSSNLLGRRVATLGLDLGAIESCGREFLEGIKRRCIRLTFAGPAKRTWGAIPTTRFGKAIVRTGEAHRAYSVASALAAQSLSSAAVFENAITLNGERVHVAFVLTPRRDFSACIGHVPPAQNLLSSGSRSSANPRGKSGAADLASIATFPWRFSSSNDDRNSIRRSVRRRINRGPSKVSEGQLARIVSEVDLELIFIKPNRHVFGSMYGRHPVEGTF